MKQLLWPLVALLTLLSACNSGSLKPNSAGAAYELLLVIDDSVYHSAVGDTLRMFLNQDMPCMPQSEPLFNLSKTNKSNFSDLLRPARNLLIVHVGDLYSTFKVKKSHDRWATPQAIIVVQGPDIASIAEGLGRYQDAIIDFFVESEHQNAIKYQKKSAEAASMEKVRQLFNVSLTLPKGLVRTMEATNFLWIANNNLEERQNILVYTTPWHGEALSRELLLAERDSVLKANLPGPTEGSYVTTEYNYEAPQARSITFTDGQDGMEVRGLWRVEGNFMGGPFVSVTRIDAANQRKVTAEVFLYAPNKYKRNLLRRLEAVLYTLH